jgi:hypothetical protein
MSRFLVLLPAPEAEWAQLPESEHEKGMASHGQFHQDLASGGHTIVMAGPLEPSAMATSMRPHAASSSSSDAWPSKRSVNDQ